MDDDDGRWNQPNNQTRIKHGRRGSRRCLNDTTGRSRRARAGAGGRRRYELDGAHKENRDRFPDGFALTLELDREDVLDGAASGIVLGDRYGPLKFTMGR